MPPLRVLIADDQPRARAALRALLSTSAEIDVLATAEGGRSALHLVSDLRPDVLVIDVEMPDLDGLEVIRQVRALWPRVRLICISMSAARREAALAAGADAFVAKTDPPEHVLAAVLPPTDDQP